MFEKFTERARKVMTLARHESQRLNSEYIGTEHILLGILVEGGGVAARILRKMDITTDAVYPEIAKLVRPSTAPVVHLGQIPLSPRTKRVLELAEEEAVSKHLGTVGTGEILIGLLREVDGVAAQILKRLRVDYDRVCAEVRRIQEQEVPDLKEALSASQPSSDGVKMVVRILGEKKTTSKATPVTIVMNGRYYEEVSCIQISGVRQDKTFSTAMAIAAEAGAECYIVEFD